MPLNTTLWLWEVPHWQ